MMTIKVLDKTTSEQIAAGEVIENPASVVKELVENALDAGATRIEVATEEGGKKMIVVTDNGSGIISEEMPLAFKRFATSKLARLDDLDTLTSLGFRGEALPSIAAVSRVTMISRMKDMHSGAKIELRGGDIINHCDVGAPIGTRVEVSELFFNTPGRFKFLRADSVESTRISTLLAELALAHPQVAFSLKSGKRGLFSSSGDGILKHVIAEIYGNDTAETLIKIEGKESEIKAKIEGYITAPHQTRSSRRWITLVINERVVKNALLVNALQRGYSDLLPRNRFPLAVLHMKLPGHTIDINVHPTKEEVRFQKPELVKTLLYRAVRMALQHSNSLPAWPAEAQPDYRQPLGGEEVEVSDKISSFFDAPARYEADRIKHHDKITNLHDFQDYSKIETPGQYRLIGQFLQSYLVVEKDDELLLIDQHAAHERVNYHRLSCLEQEGGEERGVQLTLPLTLELPAAWQEQMTTLMPLLKEYGFDINSIGECSYVVRTLPVLMRGQLVANDLYDILEKLIGVENYKEHDKRELMRKSLACHRSIKARQGLSRPEMEQLLTDWASTPSSNICPHGRPTVISFGRETLEKSFHRRGR